MMIKIDRLSIERKSSGEIPGICAKMAVHVKHSVVPRYRLPGGGGWKQLWFYKLAVPVVWAYSWGLLIRKWKDDRGFC